MKPLVSIICITFNQKKYIKQTLDGFLNQKTNFNFEILIHDDASTDMTASILQEYAQEYPEIVKPIFETENQYSKGTFQFVNDMFIAAQGKYIAMCEGDDYWTDPLKLQKQVDFLEANSDYSLCFHSVNIFYEDRSRKDHISPDTKTPTSYTIGNLLKDNYIYTCSVMYRAQPYEKLVNSVLPQDIYLHLFHAQNGKIGFIKDVMAAYRKQSEGIWWDSGKHMTKIYKKHRFQLTKLFSELLKIFGNEPKYAHIINQHVDHLFRTFIDIDTDEKLALFQETAKDFPQLMADFAIREKIFIEELKTENKRLNKVVAESNNEIALIKNSRWYKLNPRNSLK